MSSIRGSLDSLSASLLQRANKCVRRYAFLYQCVPRDLRTQTIARTAGTEIRGASTLLHPLGSPASMLR